MARKFKRLKAVIGTVSGFGLLLGTAMPSFAYAAVQGDVLNDSPTEQNDEPDLPDMPDTIDDEQDEQEDIESNEPVSSADEVAGDDGENEDDQDIESNDPAPVEEGDEDSAGEPVALGDEVAGAPVALGDEVAGEPVAVVNDAAETTPEKSARTVIATSQSGWEIDRSGHCDIPEGITRIPNEEFAGIEVLRSVSVPDSVTSIGDNAFDGCSGLSSISLPEGVKAIGFQAFMDCSKLSSINIPSTVKTIGEQAFSRCCSLSSITIPDGVTAVKSFAFENCDSLTSVDIPDTVKTINDSAFKGCSSLATVSLPANLTTIGISAFEGCSSLSSVVFPDSVQSIDDCAFLGCGLTEISLPTSLAAINYGVFMQCRQLASVSIPKNIETIGSNAFYRCSSLVYYDQVQGLTPAQLDAFAKGAGSVNRPLPAVAAFPQLIARYSWTIKTVAADEADEQDFAPYANEETTKPVPAGDTPDYQPADIYGWELSNTAIDEDNHSITYEYSKVKTPWTVSGVASDPDDAEAFAPFAYSYETDPVWVLDENAPATTPKDIEGWELAGEETNNDTRNIIYFYKRKTCWVTFNYIEKETGNKLAPSITRKDITVEDGFEYGDLKPELNGVLPDKFIKDFEGYRYIGFESNPWEEYGNVTVYYEKIADPVVPPTEEEIVPPTEEEITPPSDEPKQEEEQPAPAPAPEPKDEKGDLHILLPKCTPDEVIPQTGDTAPIAAALLAAGLAVAAGSAAARRRND